MTVQKKRGQYQNFRKKYLCLKKQYPNYTINAIMWFIDNSFTKNYKYYQNEVDKENNKNIEIHILYGESLFTQIFNREDVWNEIYEYLIKNKKERSDEILNIPSFDTSEEIFMALQKLKKQKSNLLQKLLSDSPIYIQLRRELFPTEENLKT